jgi:hypothetical protein
VSVKLIKNIGQAVALSMKAGLQAQMVLECCYVQPGG